jgi:hypothetical protein
LDRSSKTTTAEKSVKACRAGFCGRAKKKREDPKGRKVDFFAGRGWSRNYAIAAQDGYDITAKADQMRMIIEQWSEGILEGDIRRDDLTKSKLVESEG